MAHFYLKLVSPRTTFAMDMSDDERAIMLKHRAYMDHYFALGKVLVFGPVLDPQGVYGMGIFEVEDLAEANAIVADDPSVKSGLNRVEIYPMRIGGAQASREQ